MGAQQTPKQHKKLPARQTPSRVRQRTLWKWLGGIGAALALIVTAIIVAFRVSPWPGALLIRYEFDKGGTKTAQALEKYLPAGVASIQNQHYHAGKDTYLDVFYPEDKVAALPTIVWVHGGAWVSGNKQDTDNYLKVLAARGFTTVSINYSIAPEKTYPTPIIQVNEALGYVRQHAAQLHINPDRIALAGDSAGSQIVAQVATIITNPSYANEMNIAPNLPANQLKALVLNCGAYDLKLPDYNGADGSFLRTVLWAYTGTKHFLTDPRLRHASVVSYVTAAFPPSFVTAGNADPLEAQSRELAAKLSGLGVPVVSLFYPADHTPKLPHEYQFNLDNADGKHALEQIVSFLQTRL